MVKVLVTFLIVRFLSTASLPQAFAEPCDTPNDRARDGRRCGDRAASERSGGR
jgi:hypothetical protein